MESVGERLRRLRLERGLSQRELSSPGVSYAYISRIEAGARRPSVKALRMLARKLGVSAEYLETGSEIDARQERELRLADAELGLRLDGHEDEATDELRRVLDDAVLNGDSESATRAQVALGLGAHAAGRDTEAIALLETAVEDDGISPTVRPDAYASLGRSYVNVGRADRAVELFEQCLTTVTEDTPDDTAAQIRFATYLSYALTDAGDTDRAHGVLDDALNRAEGSPDPYTRVRVLWSLGRLSMNEGRPLEALGYFRRAVALLEATEDTLHLARAHLSCAWVLIEAGRAEDAGPQLDHAERLLGAQAEPGDVLMLRIYQGRRAVAMGDPRAGLALAQEALAIAGEGYPEDRGTALLTVADARAALDDPQAEAAYEQATRHIEEHGPRRFRSEAYRGWSRVLRRLGRESEALDLLERATEVPNTR